MKYQGKEGFYWFTGVVEDRSDPLYLNRVRVRIHGSHSHDKQLIATPDLPWSQVLLPSTSASLSGLGTTTHSLVEGSIVMGFYRDGKTVKTLLLWVRLWACHKHIIEYMKMKKFLELQLMDLMILD